MATLDPLRHEELPSPSPELEYLRILAEAFILSSARSEAVAFLTAIAMIVREEEDGADVVRMSRGAAHRSRARRLALAALRRDLPKLVGRLGDNT